MNAAADCAPIESPRRWARMALNVALASIAVGLFVSTLEHTLDAVLDNLLYAECIGMSIFGVFFVLRRGLSADRRLPFGSYAWRALVSIAIGYPAGVNLAALLRGRPVGLPSLTSMAPFAIAVTVVTSVGITYFFWSRGRIAEAAKAEADAHRTSAEARLKLLQTQIEPHMLFNTLANLRSLIDVDTARAQVMIDQLIVYLRGTLAASRSATVPIEDEFAQLAAYLELMRVRMASRLRVEIDLPDALHGLAIPPMLLQPIVENAIKHGLEPKVDGGTVRVSAAAIGDRLRFDVEDDGVGLDGDAHDAGYGLTHVRDRLRLLYGDAANVALEARDNGGVRVRIDVPR